MSNSVIQPRNETPPVRKDLEVTEKWANREISWGDYVNTDIVENAGEHASAKSYKLSSWKQIVIWNIAATVF